MTIRGFSKRCSAASSRCGSSPITCTIPISRAAPRISGSGLTRGNVSSACCAAGYPGCASRAMCSTYRAATARCRSVDAPYSLTMKKAAGSSRIRPARRTSTRLSQTKRTDLGLRMPEKNLLMIIVGGDALALSTARELCQLRDRRIVVLWPADAEFAGAVEGVGAEFVAGRPDSRDGLEMAGVADAITILALSRDDQLNL